MKFLGILLLFGIGGATAWKLGWVGESVESVGPAESTLFQVRRGDLLLTITENGYLKAKKSVSLKPKFRGQGVLTWIVDEGDEVAEGDVLAEFDKTKVQTDLTEEQQRLIQYETELEAAKAQLKIQERDNEANIEKADVQQKIQELTYERYVKGEYPNELRKMELAAKKAKSQYQRAKERFEQVPRLHEEGFLTAIQVEEERIKVEEAEINLQNAERELELYKAYTYPMELAQKESDVRNAERELTNSREKAEINTKEKEAQVSHRTRRIETTKSRIGQLEEELEALTMKAPQPGVVLYGDPARPWDRDRIKVGGSIYQGLTVFTLPDLSEMQVLVDVHEADINEVAVDQPVSITVETNKGESFTGTVTEVATVATSSDWGDDTNKQFRVVITMDPSETKLRAGITAKVEIQIGELEDVLHVPVHAVLIENGEHFAFVHENGETQRRTVEVGRNNAHYVEVVEGLEEGERVLLYDPREEGRSGESSSREASSGDEEGDGGLGATGLVPSE